MHLPNMLNECDKYGHKLNIADKTNASLPTDFAIFTPPQKVVNNTKLKSHALPWKHNALFWTNFKRKHDV